MPTQHSEVASPSSLLMLALPFSQQPHLAHGEAQLSRAGPASAQADLEQSPGDAGGVGGDVHEVCCEAEGLDPRAADVGLEVAGRQWDGEGRGHKLSAVQPIPAAGVAGYVLSLIHI